MPTFNLLVLTPDKTVYQDDVVSAIFPGKDGFFEVLANHAPIIAMMKPGVIEITDKNRNKHQVAVQEGFFEFYQNKGVLLTINP